MLLCLKDIILYRRVRMFLLHMWKILVFNILIYKYILSFSLYVIIEKNIKILIKRMTRKAYYFHFEYTFKINHYQHIK